MATLKDLEELFEGRKPVDVAMEINGFTGFRTTRIEDLTKDEINHLYAIHVPTAETADAEFNAFKVELMMKAWRSKVLAAAEKAGFKKAASFHEFNNWMMMSSKYKKQLTAHSMDELKELHKQIHAAISNNNRSAEMPMTEAWWKKADRLKNHN